MPSTYLRSLISQCFSSPFVWISSSFFWTTLVVFSPLFRSSFLATSSWDLSTSKHSHKCSLSFDAQREFNVGHSAYVTCFISRQFPRIRDSGFSLSDNSWRVFVLVKVFGPVSPGTLHVCVLDDSCEVSFVWMLEFKSVAFWKFGINWIHSSETWSVFTDLSNEVSFRPLIIFPSHSLYFCNSSLKQDCLAFLNGFSSTVCLITNFSSVGGKGESG